MKRIIIITTMKAYAYIRVSTEMQSYENQKFEIENWCNRKGIVVEKWIKETVSGTKRADERLLGRLLRKMKSGDVLICTELSRLGRNMMMVMSILNTCSQKRIGLYSIKDHFELADTLNSKIIAFAFSLASEIERNLISQRTREALAAKKAAGVKLGRPPGRSKDRIQFDNLYPEIARRLAEKEKIGTLAKEMKIHRNTLSRYLKEVKTGKNQEKPKTF